MTFAEVIAVLLVHDAIVSGLFLANRYIRGD